MNQKCFFLLLVVLSIALYGCRRAEVTHPGDEPSVEEQPVEEPQSEEDDRNGHDQLPEAAVLRMTDFFQKKVIPARYMEHNCEPAEYPGWEGFPLIQCRYTSNDGRWADVIMLNPSAEQMARWVVHACLEVTSSAEPACTRRLSKHIKGASGGQFPIAGIVYEDQPDENGKRDDIEEIYCFRNGVTVGTVGVAHQGIVQPTEEEVEASLFGQVTWVGVFARIQSTTPQQYAANGGTVTVVDSNGRPTKAWPEVIRESYQAAWGQDDNELMIAWARSDSVINALPAPDGSGAVP